MANFAPAPACFRAQGRVDERGNLGRSQPTDRPTDRPIEHVRVQLCDDETGSCQFECRSDQKRAVQSAIWGFKFFFALELHLKSPKSHVCDARLHDISITEYQT